MGEASPAAPVYGRPRALIPSGTIAVDPVQKGAFWPPTFSGRVVPARAGLCCLGAFAGAWRAA
eukprot:4556815-Prorocentrum_lima.AAC.1